ncbi:MAG: hypothetical protein ACC661_02470, partial [Verrucomicrobiales bacterium]
MCGSPPAVAVAALIFGCAIFAMSGSGLLFAAAPAKVLDLDAAPVGGVTRVFGSTGTGVYGVPTAGGHDCDGDGLRDFAFAQIVADPMGRTDAGQVTLIFGDGTIGTDIDTGNPSADILEILGTHTREIAGNEIWIDDVDGDGLGDLLIGRQNFTVNYGQIDEGARSAGALTIIFGDSDLRTLGTLDLASPPAGVAILTLVGASDYDRLGIWMRTGDIDGDGVNDIAVGADEVDESGGSLSDNSGALYVVRGGSHLLALPALIDLADLGNTALAGNIALIHPPAGSAKFHFGAT